MLPSINAAPGRIHMNILIIKLSSIGDVVHTLPALKALGDGLPGSSIDWLVEEPASGILKGNTLIRELIVVKNHGWLRDFRGNLRAARLIASRRYDIVIDFQGLLKSAVWVFISSGARRIGFARAREMSSFFLNEKVPPFDPERHAVDRYLDLAKHVVGSGDGDGAKVTFPIITAMGDMDRVLRLLDKAGVPGGGEFFVINPFARWRTKLWPVENFARLAAVLMERLGIKAVIIGSGGDAEGARAIAAVAGTGAVNLAGRTTLIELACLMSIARFVVTVDSGPMHIAAAVGTRVIALFGPTAASRTGPYGQGHVVIRKDSDCSPCLQKTCEDVVCMEEITVEDVADCVSGVYDNEGAIADSMEEVSR